MEFRQSMISFELINLSTSSLEPEGATIQYLRHMDKQLFMMEKEPDIGSLDQPIYQIFLKQHVTSQSTNTSSLRCGKWVAPVYKACVRRIGNLGEPSWYSNLSKKTPRWTSSWCVQVIPSVLSRTRLVKITSSYPKTSWDLLLSTLMSAVIFGCLSMCVEGRPGPSWI